VGVMPFVTIPVGIKEKHTLRITYDLFSRKLVIYVDDLSYAETYLTGVPKEFRIEVGNEERHTVNISIRGSTIPVVSVYIDGSLLGVFR